MAGWLSGLCQNLSSALLPFTQSSLRVFRAETHIFLLHSKTGILLTQNWTELSGTSEALGESWYKTHTRMHVVLLFTECVPVFHAFISTQRFFSAVQMQKDSMLLSYVCQNGDRNETVLLCYINIWMLGLIKLAYQYAFLFRHNAIKGSNRNGLTCQN